MTDARSAGLAGAAGSAGFASGAGFGAFSSGGAPFAFAASFSDLWSPVAFSRPLSTGRADATQLTLEWERLIAWVGCPVRSSPCGERGPSKRRGASNHEHDTHNRELALVKEGLPQAGEDFVRVR